ncbi:MAG TPA: hypothetical protein VG651_13140 [Stellaceae bacterium]|nr:hypothetical protein [Stellaceae bacterium]
MRSNRQAYDAEKARSGEVVLRKPWERAVFVFGLAAAVLLGLVLAGWGWWHGF